MVASFNSVFVGTTAAGFGFEDVTLLEDVDFEEGEAELAAEELAAELTAELTVELTAELSDELAEEAEELSSQSAVAEFEAV